MSKIIRFSVSFALILGIAIGGLIANDLVGSARWSASPVSLMHASADGGGEWG
jgi:hypothetical protein